MLFFISHRRIVGDRRMPKKPQLTTQKPVCQTQRAFVLWPGRAPQPQPLVDAVVRGNTTS